jgi:hypothetical protein
MLPGFVHLPATAHTVVVVEADLLFQQNKADYCLNIPGDYIR